MLFYIPQTLPQPAIEDGLTECLAEMGEVVDGVYEASRGRLDALVGVLRDIGTLLALLLALDSAMVRGG